MNIHLHWRCLGTEQDPGWQLSRCMYAYAAPHSNEILYIGKAWGKTVRERWCRSGKEDFWDDLEQQRGIGRHATLLGEVALLPGCRFTHELLSDIESLLIHRLQPWGNIQSRTSRIERPELSVRCIGTWPPSRKLYEDS